VPSSSHATPHTRKEPVMAKPKLSTPSVNYGPKPGATPTPPIKDTPIEKVPVPRGK
jgi:hypothetical protein